MVIILGLTLVGALGVSAVFLVRNPGQDVPNTLVALGSGALGALAGLFK